MTNVTISGLEARKLLFQRKLKSKVISDAMIDSWESIPGASELTALKGQLSLLELRGTDTSKANKLATGSDGVIDPLLNTAALICQTLVLTDSKERFLTDDDSEGVATWGLSVLKPLEDMLTALSENTQKVVEESKKNSSTTPPNVSSEPSTETLAPASVVTETGLTS